MNTVTYRIVQFHMRNAPTRFVGIAWDYDRAVLFSTKDCASYSDAWSALHDAAIDQGQSLRYFDGEYERFPGDDTMYPIIEKSYS